MPDKLSIEQFAAEIKKRRPDLANIPNDTLVGKTLGAAPELKEFVNLDTTMPAPEGILSQLFGHLGVQKSDPASPIVGTSPVGAPIINPAQPSVASEGAAQSLAGMGKFVAGIPGAIKSGTELALGGNTQKQLQTLVDAVKAVAGGAKTGAGMVTNPPPPESPQWQQAQQAAGANLVASELPNVASGGSALIDAVRGRIPSAAAAGSNFQQVMGKAANQPLNLVDADAAAQRALELAGKGRTIGTGSSMPKVMSDYIRQRGLLDPNQNVLMRNPITYETGRDFATNAGALSASEKMATNPVMGRQVAKFAEAMKTANRGAAVNAGMGDLYDSAMAEYHAAKTAEELAAVTKKWIGRAAIAAGLGAAGKVGYELYGAATR